MGLAAALGVIFGSPLFGYSFSVEEERTAEYDRPVKMVTYIMAILGGFGVFVLLGRLFGGGAGLPRLTAPDIGNRERFSVIVLIPGLWPESSIRSSMQGATAFLAYFRGSMAW